MAEFKGFIKIRKYKWGTKLKNLLNKSRSGFALIKWSKEDFRLKKLKTIRWQSLINAYYIELFLKYRIQNAFGQAQDVVVIHFAV
jgi:hypothetical protein